VTYGTTATDATSGLASLVFNPASGSHFAPSATPYTVNYTATDNAGNQRPGSFTVTVNPAGFVGSVLYVVGTSGNDTMTITETSTTRVTVTMSGWTSVPGSPFTVGSANTISAYGNASDDTMTATVVSGGPNVRLFGGAGNDTLTINGAGNGMMLGGDGNDTLNANGSGRTLLIGGAGADTLTSGTNGQAMMIGVSTNYDANITALDAILAEWSSTRSYSTRISNIRTGAGLATGYALNGNLIDDGVANTLTGPTTGSARNWFITVLGKTPADRITKRGSETTSSL
jgi:Ca2+-binding RTX toxin-like protein